MKISYFLVHIINFICYTFPFFVFALLAIYDLKLLLTYINIKSGVYNFFKSTILNPKAATFFLMETLFLWCLFIVRAIFRTLGF